MCPEKTIFFAAHQDKDKTKCVCGKQSYVLLYSFLEYYFQGEVV